MTAIFEDRELATGVADKLRVFAQPQRLMILSCLLRDERNVAEIGEAAGIGQPALSQQLAELRRAALVTTRKEAKLVYYALADDGVRLCVETMEAMFAGKGEATTVASGPTPPAGAARKANVAGAASFARIV